MDNIIITSLKTNIFNLMLSSSSEENPEPTDELIEEQKRKLFYWKLIIFLCFESGLVLINLLFSFLSLKYILKFWRSKKADYYVVTAFLSLSSAVFLRCIMNIVNYCLAFKYLKE